MFHPGCITRILSRENKDKPMIRNTLEEKKKKLGHETAARAFLDPILKKLLLNNKFSVYFTQTQDGTSGKRDL